jgi:hypothetical protein
MGISINSLEFGKVSIVHKKTNYKIHYHFLYSACSLLTIYYLLPTPYVLLWYPTANIALPAGTVADGVYALRISFDGSDYLGVGTYREAISLFEAHLFDFSGDLYDQTLTIEILGTIRDNQRFGSLDELKIQIQKDATMAKTFAF